MSYSKHKKAKRKKPQHGQSGANKVQIVVMVAVPAMLALGAGIVAMKYIAQPKIGDDFCYDAVPQTPHMIAFDFSYTSRMSQNQSRDYQRVFENAYTQAAANTRFDIFTTANNVDGSLAKPVASICKPPQTQEQGKVLGVPSKTQAMLDKQSEAARSAYETIAQDTIDNAHDPDKSAGESAILEQIQSISRYSGFSGSKRHFTLVSDGLQNSELARFCIIQGDLPAFETFKTRSEYRYVAPESFDGADVNIMLVESTILPHERMPYCTNDEVRQFWLEYFKGNDAANVRLTRLRYGAE